MAKVLLTNKNSVWGVIVRPQSSNVYRHVMSFDTPALKDQFIKDEVMNGEDYKVEIQKKSSVSLIYNDAASATYQADPKDYPNDTIYELLNKDFAIVLINDYEKDPAKHKYLFYALTPKRNGSTVTYGMELDIFFTYDIKDMFNDKETEITRAMFDRFIKDANGNIVPRENYLNTPLVNKESFDNRLDNLRYPIGEPKELFHELKVREWTEYDDSYIDSQDGKHVPMTLAELNIAKELISKIKWQMLSVITKVDENIPTALDPKKIFSQDGSTEVNNTFFNDEERNREVAYPYINFFAPSFSKANFNKIITDLPNGDLADIKFRSYSNRTKKTMMLNSFEKNVIENVSVLKNSLIELSTSPLSIFEAMDIVVHNSVIGKDHSFAFYLVQLGNDPATASTPNWSPIVQSDKNIYGFNIRTGVIAIANIKKTDTIIDPKIKIINDIQILDITKKRNIEYEPKLNFSPYSIYELGSSTKNKGVLIPENFTKNEIKLKLNNSYLTSNWGYIIELNNYSNINNQNNPFLSANLGYAFEDFSNYGIPTDRDSWEEFLVRNRSQQNASFLNKGVGLSAGILGAIAAPFTGGASLGIGLAVGLGSIAAKSASDINSQFAQRKDIKNTPNQIENNGSTFSYDYVNKPMYPYIQRKTLDPVSKQQIFDHIYKYGYPWNYALAKPSNLIGQRYYFNYLEASDMFENIKLNLSAPIKQIINDTLESGVTIWNYRDPATFKGVKNYEYENVEMSLI